MSEDPPTTESVTLAADNLDGIPTTESSTGDDHQVIPIVDLPPPTDSLTTDESHDAQTRCAHATLLVTDAPTDNASRSAFRVTAEGVEVTPTSDEVNIGDDIVTEDGTVVGKWVVQAGRKYPVPLDDEDRLQVLRDTGILDTNPEPAFDAITCAVKKAFNAKFAMISLVDSDRQWFKSKQGLTEDHTTRCVAFCAHAIMPTTVGIFLVPDARADPRFIDSPLVVDEPHIRFYAGAPIKIFGEDKYVSIGTVCVMDTELHPDWGPADTNLLIDLTSVIADEIAVYPGEVTDMFESKYFLEIVDRLMSKHAKAKSRKELIRTNSL